MSKILTASVFLALCICGATITTTAQRLGAPRAPATTNGNDGDSNPLGSPELEMLEKQRIASADSRYREFKNRAHEGARLAATLQQGYAQNNSNALNQAGWKSLERIAKLARQIRDFSGGSNDDDDDTAQRNSQSFATSSLPLNESLRTLAEFTAQLADAVENTPKHVVSATIINRANDVIDLVEQLKRANRSR